MKILHIVMFATLTPFLLANTGCDTPISQVSEKKEQSVKAQEVANSINFGNNNAEIDNIKDRLELTADPALLGFIVVTNQVGNVIHYGDVLGKITSGGKRLTKNWEKVSCDKGEWYGDCIVPAPSDEGTYGNSNPYVYWRNTAGVYFQTDMQYFYSTAPIRGAENALNVDITIKSEDYERMKADPSKVGHIDSQGNLILE